ncbi:MAG TPA: SDR family oxidoreductase [Gemmatimonadales bacterium]|nr:SDR family oxidoreductase [Gemmatimonadales bacterium]
MLDALIESAPLPQTLESEAWWARARGLIPAGTQTMAKGPGQHVMGVSPKYVRRGRGSHVWDVDGTRYLDMTMGIGPLVLGYGHPAVDAAIRRQLDDGITFSLMHPLEVQVAEQIRAVVPCAESVRFSKTGADVTSAAIRLARAFTGRSKVLCCGYHGWHDWFVGTTDRAAGITEAVREDTFTFDYNNPDSFLAAMDDEIAAVILEPMVFEEPHAGFLELLRERCTLHGALLIFDEMWTGFRLAVGGAQQHFGVRPDLATFSKAVANGMPLSVLAGRADCMRLFDKEVFFFTTFGGEALSLAAAQATIDALVAEDVPSHLAVVGGRIRDGVNALAESIGLADRVKCQGAGCRSLLAFSGADPLLSKSLVHQELLRRGVLWSGSHVVSAAHDDEDVDHILGAYAEVLPILKEALGAGDVRARIKGAPIEPSFRRASGFNTKPRGPKAAAESDGLSRFSLQGQVAVVTGASGLLGREHALALAEAGATVVLVDLNEPGMAKVAEAVRAVPGVGAVHTAAASVTDAKSLEKLRADVKARFSKVDILINNAALNDKVEDAGSRNGDALELDGWRRMMDVNVTGVYLPCEVFGPDMAAQGSGSIINVASTYGLVGPDPALYEGPDGKPGFTKAPAYPASKGAVISLTRHLAARWGRQGVRVNALVPGGVENGQPDHFISQYARRTPLGRMAAPDDYRGAIVFLASQASRYMTGATLVVDGGFTAC